MNLIVFLLKSVYRNGRRGYNSFVGGVARDLRYYSNMKVLDDRKVLNVWLGVN